MMLLVVVLMLCACVTTNAQQVINKQVVIHKYYDTDDCTNTAAYTTTYVQGACIDNSYNNRNESFILTCNNNIPSKTSYDGSATCTGTAVVTTAPATCTR